MLAGPLAGIHDPTGHGRLLFAFFAAMAETERENIRESTFEGLDAAAARASTAAGRHVRLGFRVIAPHGFSPAFVHLPGHRSVRQLLLPPPVGPALKRSILAGVCCRSPP